MVDETVWVRVPPSAPTEYKGNNKSVIARMSRKRELSVTGSEAATLKS